MDDGHAAVLIEVAPPVIEQPFGFGDQDIVRLLLAPRHETQNLAKTIVRPIAVLVYRFGNPKAEVCEVVSDSEVILSAWGEVYSTMEAADHARRSLT